MLDYDNDGYLDIYVTNYGRWKYPEDHHRVGDAEKKVWLYSSPRTIKTDQAPVLPQQRQPHLHRRLRQGDHDRGGGRRPGDQDQDEGARVPKPRADGHGFGVVTADVNDDGLIDIYVANDMNPNFLFLNRGDGTFDDVSEISGAAYNINGRRSRAWASTPRTSTATAFPSCSSPTSPTSTTRSTTTSARASSTTTPPSSAWRPTRCPGSSGAARLADFDNDGWPDCFFVNGHVDNNRRQLGPAGRLRGDPAPVPQPGRASGSAWRPGTPGLTSTPSTSAGARPSATSTTTATSTSWSTTRTAPRPAPQRHQVEQPLDPVRPPGDQEQPRRDRRQASRSIAGERTIYRQRKGGYSMQATNDPRVLVGVGPATRGQEGRRSAGRRASSARSKTSRSTRTYKVVEPKDGAAKPAAAKPAKP